MPDTLRLSEKVGIPLVRMLLRLSPYGANLVDTADDLASFTRGIGDFLDSRRTERALLDVADIAADKLDHFLRVEFSNAESGDLNAAIASVGDVIKAVETNTELLVEHGLDATRLRAHMMNAAGKEYRRTLYSENAQYIFDLLLEESCDYLVEIVTNQPDFTPKAVASMVHTGKTMSDKIDEILTRLPSRSKSGDRDASANAFATRYKRNIARRFDRLELFGIDLERTTRRYSLNTAYISLRSESSLRDQPGSLGSATGTAVESVLADSGNRIVVCGEAGCGKTTLLQWAAVSAARGDFPPKLNHWNELIPFVVRLRTYNKQPLPSPEQLTGEAGVSLSALQPEGWCTEILQAGSGLVLVDGLDEVPDAQRAAVYDWLDDLVESFPDNYYIVTSRPAALRKSPSALRRFKYAWLLPMEPPEIRAFIQYWHLAISENVDTEEELEEVVAHGESLVGKILTSAPLRSLASSPLLCAVTCALHYSRKGSLPRRRVKLYESALSMLLGRRDEAQGIDTVTISPEEKQEILEDLAEWFIINGDSEAPRSQVVRRIRKTLKAMPHVRYDEKQTLDHLVERSGVLREPVPNTIDFVHRTFQEYLASRALVKGGNISLLVKKALDSDWQEVIALAAGHAPPQEGDLLLNRLVAQADSAAANDRNRLYLLCVACVNTAIRVDPKAAERIYAFVAKLIPPKSPGAMSSVIAIGEVAIPLLAEKLLDPELAEKLLDPDTIEIETLSYAVDSLVRIGGEEALAVLSNMDPALKTSALESLLSGWSYFDPLRYAEDVLKDIRLEKPMVLELRDIERVKFTKSLPDQLLIHFRMPTIPEDPTILSGTRLYALTISARGGRRPIGSSRGGDIRYDFLADIEGLTELEIDDIKSFTFKSRQSICPSVSELSISLTRSSHDLLSLNHFPSLRKLSIVCRENSTLWHLGASSSLEGLSISAPDSFTIRPEWPELPNLRKLELKGYAEQSFRPLENYVNLVDLTVESEDLREAYDIRQLTNLMTVDFSECAQLEDLSPLASLSSIRSVRLCRCHQYLDFAAGKIAAEEVDIEDVRTGDHVSKSEVDILAYEGEDLFSTEIEGDWPVDSVDGELFPDGTDEFVDAELEEDELEWERGLEDEDGDGDLD